MVESCEKCQGAFSGYVPSGQLELTISRSGNEVRVWAQNKSKSIIYLKRFLICRVYSGWWSVGYYRPELYIEQGVGSLIHNESIGAGELSVQAEAEYIELTGRSVSNCLSL